MRLNVFGGLCLLDEDGRPPSGRLPQRRRLAVLALIATAGDRGIGRDRVLGLLWPELDASRARHALSQALYALRLQVGAGGILSGTDILRVDENRLDVDVRKFERALEEGRDEDAVALYAGPFLQDFFVDGAPEFDLWAGSQRVRLARACADALERLAAAAGRSGDRSAAAALWRRRSELDPLDGAAALRCMRALAEAGDTAGAVRHAQAHASALHEQLDLVPDPAVLELAETLRVGRTPARSASVHASRAPAIEPAAAVEQSERRRTGESYARARPEGRWRRMLRRGGSATGALLVAGIGALFIVTRQIEPSRVRPVAIAVAGFAGPDSRLSLAVREAIRAELDAHPGVRVIAESRTVELIRLMRGSRAIGLDESQAIHLAQRAGAPLSVAGTVAPVAQGGAVIVVRLLDARTGEAIASLVQRPMRDIDVLPAIGRLGAALRAGIDGSTIDSSATALPAVTTASLPALQNYALARRALAAYDRESAIVLLRGALVHDSLFALAHYQLGDLLWYIDRQTESELHLERAVSLADQLPSRERLIVHARYAQLVLDLPDQALSFWKRLRAAYPTDPLASEGLVWANLALGRFVEAANAAETALQLDPGAAPHARNRMYGLMGMRDTAAALTFVRTSPAARDLEMEVRVGIAALRGDAAAALALIDSARAGTGDTGWAWTRHAVLLALGHFDAAASELRGILDVGHRQAPSRALLLQARAELAAGAPIRPATERIRRAAAWLEDADLSPPAVARLAERAAEAAARAGDMEVLRRMRALLADRDRGRALRSYRLASLSVDAATAFARGDHARAAELAELARRETFFGRSLVTIALLEADARAAIGQTDAATALYRAIASGAVPDGDSETAILFSELGRRRLPGSSDGSPTGRTPAREGDGAR